MIKSTFISILGGLWVFMTSSLTVYSQETANSFLTIKNPSDFDRVELVSIPYSTFLIKTGLSGHSFRILSDGGKKEYAFQLEMLGDTVPKNILIQVGVPASDEINLIVEEKEPLLVRPKTYARYVPERYDDFAWENDVIAFRLYGKALEGRPDDAQGMDLWVKRTDKLIINKWYKLGDYHTDHGEGLDYYSVGNTLGAGDVAPYVNDSLYYSKHYRRYEILDNGPLRTTFCLYYEPWNVEGVVVSLKKTISLDAGSHFNKVTLNYNFENKDQLPIAAGVVKREKPGRVMRQLENGIFGYWEPAFGKNGITGVGLLLLDTINDMKEIHNQYLTLFGVEPNKSVVYYTGGVWNKAGDITSAGDWFAYLAKKKESLKKPLQVKIN